MSNDGSVRDRVASDPLAPYVISALSHWGELAEHSDNELIQAAVRHLRLVVGHGAACAGHEGLTALASRTDLHRLAAQRVLAELGSPDPWVRYLSRRRSELLQAPQQLKADRAKETWHSIRQDRAISDAFDRHMIQRSRTMDIPLATMGLDRFVGTESTIVDVGGGPGHYAVQLLKGLGPSWRAIVLDNYPGAAGLAQADPTSSNRVRFQRADFFQTMPSHAELYLLGSILHDLSDELASLLLSRCADAAALDSILVLIEREWDPESPVDSARDLDMRLLFGGRERSNAELHRMILEVGLQPMMSFSTGGYRVITAERVKAPVEKGIKWAIG